jgi:hypothetical protein
MASAYVVLAVLVAAIANSALACIHVVGDTTNTFTSVGVLKSYVTIYDNDVQVCKGGGPFWTPIQCRPPYGSILDFTGDDLKVQFGNGVQQWNWVFKGTNCQTEVLKAASAGPHGIIPGTFETKCTIDERMYC